MTTLSESRTVIEPGAVRPDGTPPAQRPPRPDQGPPAAAAARDAAADGVDLRDQHPGSADARPDRSHPLSAPRGRTNRWIQAMAETRWATPAMCGLSFTDSCVSPVMPEILLVPMAMAHPEKRWHYAAWASAASILGGAFGYLLGALLWTNGLSDLAYAWLPGFDEKKFAEISALYGTSTFVVVFLAGFTPLPFKLFTVTAGVCFAHVDFVTFLVAAALSRTARFYLEVHVLHRVGMPLLDWVFNKSRAFTWVLLALLGITIGLVLWI